MPNPIIETCKAEFEIMFARVKKLIEVCPDDLWVAKAGGFYFWQQVYHTLAHFEFFSRREGDVPRRLPWPMDVIMFEREGLPAPSKAQMLAFADDMAALARAYMNNLSVYEITMPNKVLSAIIERPVNHLVGLLKFTAHTAYHLGCCDSLLRERGLPGVY